MAQSALAVDPILLDFDFLLVLARPVGDPGKLDPQRSELLLRKAFQVAHAVLRAAGSNELVQLDLDGHAVAVLAIQDYECLFPGNTVNKPLSNMSMLMLLRRMGYDNVTVHGFISSFRDWTGKTTSFPFEVCEQTLAAWP